MNKYNAAAKICELTNKLEQELRALPEQITLDINSFRNALSNASRTMGKKWNKTISYSKGDICSLDGHIFVSQRDGNLAQDPMENRIFWNYFINPYATNYGKLKAFVIHNHNTILSSYNIQSMITTAYTSNSSFVMPSANFYAYKFFFKTSFSEKPSFITNFPLYSVPNTIDLEFKNKALQGVATRNETGYTEVYYTTATTDSSYGRNQATDNANYSSMLLTDVIGCVMWFANDTVVPAS